MTGISLETADQRKVWACRLSSRDFYDGTRTEIGAEINWRPSGRLRVGFGYEWNDIELPQGVSSRGSSSFAPTSPSRRN